MQPTENLTLKAAALARAAPEQWREFVSALAVFNEIHRENLVKSPLAELPVNQGRAQLMGTVFAYLKDCQINADKIKKG